MEPGMKVAALYSGGKDSTYALHWGYFQGLDIECLISVYPREYSMLFHYPGIEATVYQAKAMNIDILYTNAVNNEEYTLYSLLKEAKEKYNVKGVIAGTLLSDYQRMRLAFITEKLGLSLYTPLWRIDQRSYMKEIVKNGIKFIITSVSSYGLSHKYIGRIVTLELLNEILVIASKYGLNPAFEGGEAETLVIDAPLFKQKLMIKGRIIKKGPYEARLIIDEIDLGDKIRIIIESRD